MTTCALIKPLPRSAILQDSVPTINKVAHGSQTSMQRQSVAASRKYPPRPPNSKIQSLSFQGDWQQFIKSKPRATWLLLKATVVWLKDCATVDFQGGNNDILGLTGSPTEPFRVQAVTHTHVQQLKQNTFNQISSEHQTSSRKVKMEVRFLSWYTCKRHAAKIGRQWQRSAAATQPTKQIQTEEHFELHSAIPFPQSLNVQVWFIHYRNSPTSSKIRLVRHTIVLL